MTIEEIKEVIEKGVPGGQVYLLDPNQDGRHLQGFVISSAFEGMSLVKQHQMVMMPLRQAFAETVHALGLKTFTPEKWEKEKNMYGFS